MTENAPLQSNTPDPVLSSSAFSQCAWCLCRLDVNDEPIGEPLPLLANEASHDICTHCERVYFPTQAKRLHAHQGEGTAWFQSVHGTPYVRLLVARPSFPSLFCLRSLSHPVCSVSNKSASCLLIVTNTKGMRLSISGREQRVPHWRWQIISPCCVKLLARWITHLGGRSRSGK